MAMSILSLIVAALYVRLAAGQQAGWQPDEVNTTMCYWQNPRAGVIRDTLYLDGGYLWWNPGLADGSYAGPTADGNPLGDVYLLNFSTPFNTSQNISEILGTISKASGGSGDANNIGPQYVDGTMFANDFEWFTYGGLLADTLAFQNPDAQSVAVYEKYPQVSSRQFSPGYILDDLPTDMNRYIAFGAGVSVPSENLGFYFGGLRSSTWGDIVLGTSNETLNADVESLTLIELDMSVQQKEVWSNQTLPNSVPGRASAEIVWVPVSEQGVLVAMGGVIDPVFASISLANNDSTNKASEATSPGFMQTVSVYDIANKVWYNQVTSGTVPPQLTEGCTVVASADDGSSHNIYWYGGFDGLDESGTYSDDVWILSVPSFMWMKFATGNPTHARAGHRCVKPYPDQMFVIGGQASFPDSGPPLCLDGGIIQIFNLSSGDWLDSYDPKTWSNYTVPDMIVQMIGGNGGGGATQAAPTPNGFANSSLNAVFKQSYNATKITTWYPYQPATSSPTSRPTVPVTAVRKSGTPSYLAPVLGVVLGLFFITLFILGCLLYRRRKFLRINNGSSPSENGTMSNHFWVSNWLRATPADAKAPTVTTDETPTSPYEYERPDMQEVGGTQVHEMMGMFCLRAPSECIKLTKADTSKPVELHDTGFVPLGVGRSNLAASPSVTSQTSQASTVSRDSHHSRPAVSPMQHTRADSPSLGGLPENPRITSGVSIISDSDRGHLRGISETSVSTDGVYATPLESGVALGGLPPLTVEKRPNVVSPLTPSHGSNEASEYLDASPASPTSPTPSQRRKSNFAEGLPEARK
ncbi:Kelch repeat-containing [Hyphodiscus hymeniophilus]|uniref:Kelch repeat-containing n=1 Tax=Hyphodiscus hymeniophilus TaxID=353542 RepID=A0A9P6VKM2_9HELO|nr:Kelch repeat-containing [Hyphodiscus hymeniophilus]